MKIAVEAYQITDVPPSLDGITVFWQDLGPSRGCVTICHARNCYRSQWTRKETNGRSTTIRSGCIVCYGAAWAGYFGGMGNRTIREFFKEADTSYLISLLALQRLASSVSKLGITPQLKARKTDHAYLGRIIDAIKASAEAGL